MKSLKLQPTFTKDVPLPPEEMMARIRAVIRGEDQPDGTTEVVSAGRCVDLNVSREKQRFWSPHLNVHVTENDSGAELYCRFSPRPEIWTMVMAIYFVASFFIFSAAIYGYVQWVMDMQPWALLWVPVGIAMIVSVHVASLLGQRWSSDQMQDLRHRLDQTIEEALKVTGERG